jgi:hypothetical protein
MVRDLCISRLRRAKVVVEMMEMLALTWRKGKGESKGSRGRLLFHGASKENHS